MKALAGAVAGAATAALTVAIVTPTQPATFIPGQTPTAAANTTTAAAGCVPGDTNGLDQEQVRNAQAIVAAADKAGTGEAGAVIGVATALVEGVYTRGETPNKVPGLRNVPYGHGSSVGVFQELAGSGSGFTLTTAQRMDVAGAATRFYTKLQRVPGWEAMKPGDAAQAVQRSAFPTRYAAQVPRATAIVSALKGVKCSTTAPPAGTCKPTGLAVERGLQPATLRGLRCGSAAFPKVTRFTGVGNRPNKSDHPAGRAVDFMIPAWQNQTGRQYGWGVARWFADNAETLNVKYVIYDDKIWRPAGRKAGWNTYVHPNGPTSNPTLRHLDHVHISFNEGAP